MGKPEGNKLSRRDFVKSATVLGLGGTAAGLAGCTSDGTGSSGNSDNANDGSIVWDQEYDVVVVGSGYAGLCAAVEAATGGAETIVLEKNSVAGGNSIMCGGYIQAGGGTSVQKAAGIEDTPERFFNDIYKYGHFRAEPILVQTYVDNSPALIDWLSGLGLNWNPKLQKMEGMTVDCTHVPAEGDYPGMQGISSWTVINREVTRLGVETLLNHKAVRLIQREDKTVLGLEVENEGKTLKFKARKAVVLGSGGFKANLAMRNNWDPRIDADVSAGGLPYVDTLGEMSEAAVDVGAAQRDMSFVCEFRFKWGTAVYQYWNPTNIETIPDYQTGFAISDYNRVIIVKNDGKRFVSEHAAGEYPQAPFYEAFLNLKEHPRSVWLIADQGTADALKWNTDILNNPDPDSNPNLSPDRVMIANTIEELASKIGVDPGTLADEVKRYNGFVDSGTDEDFGKAELPNKIETAPFYALKLIFFAHDQQAGLTVNTKSQVISRTSLFGDVKQLDARDTIPHLYACGEVCGGYFGEERGHSKIGVHMFWGRNAGKNAAQEPEIV